MSYIIKEIVRKSRIINFLKDFNRNMLLFFFESKTYKLFIKANGFFRKSILENADESAILKWIQKVYKKTTVKDVGVFIIFVVLFNTIAMLAFKNRIDVFSVYMRAFFLSFGVFLVVKKR